MKNPTDQDINYRGFVIRAGETVPNADLSPEAVTWFARHGCEDEAKKKTTKKTAAKSDDDRPRWSPTGD